MITHLFLVIACLAIFFVIYPADAIPWTSEENKALDADAIAVGQIVSYRDDGAHRYYEISVIKWIKNPQLDQTITMRSITPKVFDPHVPYAIFEKKDLGLFYVKLIDGEWRSTYYSKQIFASEQSQTIYNMKKIVGNNNPDSSVSLERICKEGHVNAVKNRTGEIYCVKPQTLQKLRERGWAELPLILEDEWVRQPALSINNHDPSNLQTPVVRILEGSASPESQVQLDPKTITIVLGINNTVTWINEDLTSHTLTSNENSGWSTRIILPEKNATVIFNHTGIFEYHGTPHPWITGKVIVLENEKTVPPKSVPLTLFPVTPQNVTLPNSKKILTDTTMISINKINQITITNSDPNGQKTHPTQITMKSVTLHSKGIESLPAQSGINILVFDYSIQSKDKDAFYATLDFEIQFGKQAYPILLKGDAFSTPLLPDQKRDSTFVIQIGKNVNEITMTIKDQVTKKTLWAIPLDLTPFNIKYRESSGILIQENEN